ncbi:hypothetical protein [Flagellimonas lutimaris]|uniref:hypothetical protein n=1 Tax=Flagellimonas lutimaris TaxID=475082 RepID=UPI0039C0F510
MKTIRITAMAIMCMGAMLVSCSGEDGEKGLQGDQGPKGDSITGEKGDQGDPGTDGISCWDLNGNGIGDAEEDVNQDGNYDSLDCQGADGADGVNGIACWDLNGNGIADITNDETNEDINLDGTVDALDCQGTDGADGINGVDGNANVFYYVVGLQGFSGTTLNFDLLDVVSDPADYAFLFYLEESLASVNFLVPGNYRGNLQYTTLQFKDSFNNGDATISFYNSVDDSLYFVPEGELSNLTIVAIEKGTQVLNLNLKSSQENVLSELKAAGVDVNDYHAVVAYFGLE